MPATSQGPEADLMDQVANEYGRRGYDVILEPNPQDLPDVLRTLRPDLLASRDDDHVVVFVKTSRRALPLQPAPDVDVLRDEGWRVEVFFADDPAPPIASPDVVIGR